MSSIAIALLVGALTFGLGIAGHYLRRRLPERHMATGSKEMIGALIGLVSLLLVLVLGTLIGSAYGVYATQRTNVETLCARALDLDLAFREFGPDAIPLHDALRDSMQAAYDAIWGRGTFYERQFDPRIYLKRFQNWNTMVANLNAKTPAQTRLLATIAADSTAYQQTRLLTSLELAGSISWPLIFVVASWAMLLFFGYGILSGVNSTSAAALALGSFAVASAVFLILQLSQPYAGAFRVPSGSMERTLAALSS
jgi:hypothetical protein